MGFLKIFIYLFWLCQVAAFVVARSFCGCGMGHIVGLVVLLCRILAPQPGIEPTSPALEGRFLTLGLPGMSPKYMAYWKVV